MKSMTKTLKSLERIFKTIRKGASLWYHCKLICYNSNNNRKLLRGSSTPFLMKRFLK